MAAKLTIDGSGAGAIKAIRDLNKAIDDTEKGLNESTKSAKQLETAASRITKANEGPQERYNRKMRELAELVRKGAVDMGTAERAAMRYSTQLDRAGHAGRVAFGPQLQNSIAATATQITGALGLLDKFRQAYQSLLEDGRNATQQGRGGEFNKGALAQLAAAASDPKAARARLEQEFKANFQSGAFATEDEARAFTFATNSAGLSDDEKRFAVSLRANQVVSDTSSLSKAYAATRAAFSGGDAIGSFSDVVSKALQAAEVAPGDAATLLQESVRSAGSAKALGLTDEANIVANAIGGIKPGSINQGATQIAALLKGIEEKSAERFRGKNLSEIITEIGQTATTREELAKVFGGSSEAVEGYRSLADNLPLLESLQDRVDTAATRDVAGAAIGLNARDPELLNLRRERQVKATNVLQSKLQGQLELVQMNINDDNENLARQRDPGFLTEASIMAGRFNEMLWMPFTSTTGNLERTLETRYASRGDRELANELLRQHDELRRQTTTLERIASGIDQSNARTNPPTTRQE